MKAVTMAMLMLCLTVAGIMPVQAKTSPVLNKKKVTLTVGKTVQLKVTGAKKVNWDPEGYNSDSENVVKVSSKGLVKAVGIGIQNVYVKADGKMLNCTIIVKPKKYALTVKVKENNIAVSNTSFSLTLPKVWKKYGFYIVKNKFQKDSATYAFCLKKSFNSGYYGDVFSIFAGTKEEAKIVEENMSNTYLGESNGTVYYLTTPSDVTFNEKDFDSYMDLSATIDDIAKSFKLK